MWSSPLLHPPSQDGIDIHGNDFWVHGSLISTGDDNVAIHASNVRVSECAFGTGHGASIGSLGGAVALQNITVTGVSFNGTGAAVRRRGREAA